MIDGRFYYYTLSGVLSALAIFFCILVYLAGEFEQQQFGAYFLTGIPNYYFFYIMILPFISTGFWFALLMLTLGTLVILFIKTERNQIYKYASVVAGVSSAAVAGLSWFKPEIFQQIFEIVIGLGWVYGSMFLSIFCLALYLVTDHFITNYEQEILQEQ